MRYYNDVNIIQAIEIKDHDIYLMSLMASEHSYSHSGGHNIYCKYK